MVFQRSPTQKWYKEAEAAHKTEKAKIKGSNRKSTNNKPHKQQQVVQTAAQTAPTCSKSSKKKQQQWRQHEKQQQKQQTFGKRQGCEQQQQGGWGPEGWGGQRASSRGNSVGYRKIVPQFFSKIVISILEGQTLLRWRREFDGRRAKSSNKSRNQQQLHKHKQQQKQRQQEAATGTQATSSRIRSRRQQPRKSEGQEVWLPKVERRLPVEFRLCSRFFFLDASKICNDWSSTFSEVLEGRQ